MANCSAKEVFGIYEEACETCTHNACSYYRAAKRDEADNETDYDEREG